MQLMLENKNFNNKSLKLLACVFVCVWKCIILETATEAVTDLKQ